jgi:TetR/AcrR family tetracycline transcriptional repressor
MAEEGGVETLSFRKLAARLGIKAPSLYWHVADKNDLLAAMGERLIWDCLENMPEVVDWPAWLRAFGRQLWLTQLSARDSGALLMALRSKSEGT